MIREAASLGLLTAPYVFDPDERDRDGRAPARTCSSRTWA